MNDITQVCELLSPHDPLIQRGTDLDDASIDAMWRGLQKDIEAGTESDVRAPSRHDPRLVRSAVASVVVAACVLTGLVVADGRHSPSAHHYLALQPLDYSRSVDPVPAASTLNRLAAAAAAQPLPDRTAWYYLETASWSTFTGSDASDLPAGMPGVLEQWTGPDGVQRIVDHVDLPAPAAGLKAWLDDGLPLTGGRTDTHTTPASPGQFPVELSNDPDVLEKQLLDAEVGQGDTGDTGDTGHTGHTGGPPEAAELLTAARDLRAARAIDPTLEAALLRVLATRPELISLGTATDRLGRLVDAVALDSDYSGLPTRYVLLFDPASGQLLGSEDVLTKSAGKLAVPIPSVISYAIYVRDGFVRDNTSRPPP
jgi:hypothetical protein